MSGSVRGILGRGLLSVLPAKPGNGNAKRDLADATGRGFRLIARTMSILVTPFIRFDLPDPGHPRFELPVVWAPNHRSMFDTVVGLVGLHRMGYEASFLVNARYFRSRLAGRALTAIGAIPVELEGGALQALADAAEALREGRSVVIMAEGRLVGPEERRNGIGELEPGATILAKRTHRPIVPAALVGADHILPIGRRLPRISLRARHTMVVRFGEPMKVEGRPRDAVDELTRRLSELVTEAEEDHTRLSAGQ